MMMIDEPIAILQNQLSTCTQIKTRDLTQKKKRKKERKKARDEHHVPGLNDIMVSPSSPVVWFQHFCFVFVFLINIWIYTRGL